MLVSEVPSPQPFPHRHGEHQQKWNDPVSHRYAKLEAPIRLGCQASVVVDQVASIQSLGEIPFHLLKQLCVVALDTCNMRPNLYIVVGHPTAGNSPKVATSAGPVAHETL